MQMTSKYKPQWFPCVPTIYVGLLNHPDFPKTDFSSIKGCVSGAAPLALETIREWEDKVGATIVEVYGLTETSPLSHANPWRGTTKVGSVGVPAPDTDCRIVDVETGEQQMAQGESGEILLKGPQLTQGYYNRPEETANAIRDGWFYTGDIGYMDEEGYLYIVGRKRDRIVARGHTVWPTMVEEALESHDAIEAAVAFGVPDPLRCSTDIRAAVKLDDGYEPTRVLERELIELCVGKLEEYQVPTAIMFRDDLPMTPMGKVDRGAVIAEVDELIKELMQGGEMSEEIL